MSKEERRNYLKPFRCVGGFMFAISIFVLMFSILSIGLMIFTTFVFGESGIANNINQIAKVANSRYSVSHDNYKYISDTLADFILRFERKIYSRQK